MGHLRCEWQSQSGAPRSANLRETPKMKLHGEHPSSARGGLVVGGEGTEGQGRVSWGILGRYSITGSQSVTIGPM